jgi:hypothetical protein
LLFRPPELAPTDAESVFGTSAGKMQMVFKQNTNRGGIIKPSPSPQLGANLLGRATWNFLADDFWL